MAQHKNGKNSHATVPGNRPAPEKLLSRRIGKYFFTLARKIKDRRKRKQLRKLQWEIKAIESSFDAQYYLAQYDDIGKSNMEPIRHYCQYGWREGRNPSPHFNTKFYLQANPDVAQAGINPFVHYVGTGRAEGRAGWPAATATATVAVTLEQTTLLQEVSAQLRGARSAAAQATDMDITLGKPWELTTQALCTALEASGHSQGLVIAVSHDDYAESMGGVQNILGDECAEFNRRGLDYLHLCPMRPIRSLAPQTQLRDFHFAVRLNGQALGRMAADALQAALRQLAQHGTTPYWVLHHLMGHSPEVLQALIAEGCTGAPLFWAHDFFAACTSYNLLRNDLTFCHAPPLNAPACRVCVYGQERAAHTARMRQLLQATTPTVVAPSRSALDLWLDSTGFSPARTAVLHPARLLVKEQARPGHVGALRIAYLGGQIYAKGWRAYRRLAETFAHDDRYEFFQFGKVAQDAGADGLVRNVPVRVTATDRDAMVRALVENRIDVVVCWSVWPETFNFTVHEAIAAGAFVVVRREQGHVWPAAQAYAPKASRAIQDWDELESCLRSGQLIADVQASPRYLGMALPSLGSAELIALEPQTAGSP